MFADEEVESGMSFLKVNELSPQTAELVDNEIKRLLQVNSTYPQMFYCNIYILYNLSMQIYYVQESYERAKTILMKHSKEHKNLARILLTRETLNAVEIKRILEGHEDFN